MLGRDVRESKSGNDLLDKLLVGTKFISDIVSSTLGPRGKTVILERKYGLPTVTKDGVTVAMELHLEDSHENFGCQMVKQASVKSGDVGDGTTTTVLLAHEIFKRAAEAVRGGANSVEVKKGIEAATADAVRILKEHSVPAKEEDIVNVASISANDRKIGELVSGAISGDAKKVVTVEESGTMETTVERSEGVKIPNGFISHMFVTDPDRYEAVLEDAAIILIEGKVTTQSQLAPALIAAMKGLDVKQILVIAENVEDTALGLLISNRVKGTLLPIAVKFSAFGNHRNEILSDIAVLTGGRVFGPGNASLEDPKVEDFGRAKRVVATADSTLIVGGAGSSAEIEKRKKEILAQIESAKAQYDKDRLKERFGRLSGGVTVIKVGGATETEVSELRDRVEDAIMATQAALTDGVLPGGGTATAFVAGQQGPDSNPKTGLVLGYQAVQEALRSPMAKILKNAGHEEVEIAKAILSAEVSFGRGVDVMTGQAADMVEIGVLDPTKVTVCAVQNAGSVAGSLIGSEFGVVFKAKGDPKEAADAMSL